MLGDDCASICRVYGDRLCHFPNYCERSRCLEVPDVDERAKQDETSA